MTKKIPINAINFKGSFHSIGHVSKVSKQQYLLDIHESTTQQKQQYI
jgi:hypothetical protein